MYLSSSFLIVLNAYVSIHESARHCHAWFASWHKWYTILQYTLLFFINSFWDFFISLYTDLVHFYLLMIVHRRIMLQLIYLSFYWWTLKWFSTFSFLCIFFLTSLTAQNEWKVFFFFFLISCWDWPGLQRRIPVISLFFALLPQSWQIPGAGFKNSHCFLSWFCQQFSVLARPKEQIIEVMTMDKINTVHWASK